MTKPYKGKTRKTYRFPAGDTIKRPNLMNRTVVVIMGKAVTIDYAIHEPAYVEWKLRISVDGLEDEIELLNVLLRTHYNEFIEAACREAAFYDAYAANAAADDWIDSVRYTQGIRRGLFSPGDEEEDLPF